MRKFVLFAPAVAIVALTGCEPVPTEPVVTATPVAPVAGFQQQYIQPPIQTYSASAEPVITISGDVAFDVNRATIKSEFRSELDSIADQLINSGGTSFTVVGHTDVRGSTSYNQDLSERRARAVADYLTSRGVQRSYLQVRGEGEANPIDNGSSEAAHRRNRRVEIIGSGGGGYSSTEYTTYPGYASTYSYGGYPGPQYAVPGVVAPSQLQPAPIGGVGVPGQVAPGAPIGAPVGATTYQQQNVGYSYTQAAPLYPTTPQPAGNYYVTAPYTQQVSGGYVAPSYATTTTVQQPAPGFGYYSPYGPQGAIQQQAATTTTTTQTKPPFVTRFGTN